MRCNQQALKLLGFDSVDELNHDIRRLSERIQNCDPETHEPLRTEDLPFARALRGERIEGDSEIVHLKTGERRIIRCTASPIRSHGKVIAAIAVNTDVTEERRRMQELEQSLRLRDEFLSIASHELKTPLTSLLLQLELLERTAKRKHGQQIAAEEMARSLSTPIRQTNKAVQMLDYLLDVSRIRNRRFNLEITTINLCALVNDVAMRLAPQAEQAGSPISIESCREIFAYVDPMRIEQVLVNLLTNAIKYGSRKPIDLRVDRVDGEARIHVKDQGIGF